MLANAKDYPTTLLPGATINAPNPELLKTVSVCDSSDAQIDTLNGVVVCVQQNYLTKIRSLRREGSRVRRSGRRQRGRAGVRDLREADVSGGGEEGDGAAAGATA